MELKVRVIGEEIHRLVRLADGPKGGADERIQGLQRLFFKLRKPLSHRLPCLATPTCSHCPYNSQI